MLGTHTVQALNRSSDPRDTETTWCQTTGLAENSHTPSRALTPESILGYIFAVVWGSFSLPENTVLGFQDHFPTLPGHLDTFQKLESTLDTEVGKLLMDSGPLQMRGCECQGLVLDG